MATYFSDAAHFMIGSFGDSALCPVSQSFYRIYCIDTSVLLETTPLVKFTGNYIGDPSGVFFRLTNEDIEEIISYLFTVVCANTVGEKWRAVDLSI